MHCSTTETHTKTTFISHQPYASTCKAILCVGGSAHDPLRLTSQFLFLALGGEGNKGGEWHDTTYYCVMWTVMSCTHHTNTHTHIWGIPLPSPFHSWRCKMTNSGIRKGNDLKPRVRVMCACVCVCVLYSSTVMLVKRELKRVYGRLRYKRMIILTYSSTYFFPWRSLREIIQG